MKRLERPLCNHGSICATTARAVGFGRIAVHQVLITALFTALRHHGSRRGVRPAEAHCSLVKLVSGRAHSFERCLA